MMPGKGLHDAAAPNMSTGASPMLEPSRCGDASKLILPSASCCRCYCLAIALLELLIASCSETCSSNPPSGRQLTLVQRTFFSYIVQNWCGSLAKAGCLFFRHSGNRLAGMRFEDLDCMGRAAKEAGSEP